MEKKIIMVAGEASGDLLGSQLAQQLQSAAPDIRILGIGGPKMRAAGVTIFYDATKLAVVGLFEILTHIKDIYHAKRLLKQKLQTEKPDLAVFIDYPGFNLHMARYAKKIGIRVFYYVSPQIWAWRYHRIKKIRHAVDCMAVLFEFEQKIYKKEQVPVRFVGHPIVDIAKPTLSQQEILEKYQLNSKSPIIALLPGSRQNEIKKILPTIIESAKAIQQQFPNVQFVLPLASSLTPQQVTPLLFPAIKLIENDSYNIVSVCSAAIVASGTATLEIALLKVPLVIIYKTSQITYWLAKYIVKLRHIGLCNIVAEKEVAPELIQNAATSKNIAAEIKHLLNDSAYYRRRKQQLAVVRQKLGKSGAASKAANEILKLITS